MTGHSEMLNRIRQQTSDITDKLTAGSYSLVGTSRELEAIVDKSLAPQIQAYRWFAVIARGDHVYAVADIDGRRIAMQRLVVALTENRTDFDQIKNVSFANKHSLDCRYQNLTGRVGRQAVMRNRLGKRNTSSSFKGVRKIEVEGGGSVWRAQIKADLGQLHLGSYENELDAAQAYDEAAKLLFEGSAHLNLPDSPTNPEILLGIWELIERAKFKKSV